MSKEKAEAFVERLEKEKTFRVKAREDAVRIAKEHGYECTAQELSDALKKKWGISKDSWEDGDTAFSCSETPNF